MSIFKTQDIKSVSKHVKSSEKNLGTLDLTLLSIGSVIGTGVMVLTGIVAAKEAGPGVMFSFLIGGIAAAIIVLCYAELCATIPSSGGSYTFLYVTMGEIVAYVAGLAIIIGYILATATVASGWGSYLLNFLGSFGIHFSKEFTTIPSQGGIVNLPAVLSILFITFIISCGTKNSKKVNNIMVFTKIGVILLFVIVGIFYMNTKNWIPFLPYKITGVLSGAATVFFAYCGFDATASAAPYVKNPKKSLPIGLLVSLAVCTFIYVAVSGVLTGITSYIHLNVSDALAYALKLSNRPFIEMIVSLGSVIGILAVIFAGNFSTSQILSTMSIDGLLPKIFGKKDKRDVPYVALWIVGIVGALLAEFVNLNQLANFASLAMLIVYGLISFSIIIFRKKYPNIKREFKTPLVPLLPTLGVACCLFLITNLQESTILIATVIIVILIISYFIYGKKHSKVKEENTI
ncbi:APC family permease [Clostridium thermobutyricum]|uniref:Putative amino acid permease YhdG n=1 Tax=Clostridium thermobutyricum DSM 4928 TaxID=1121339 RepID=A0A1V4SYI0_9CLOT|nr:amino acid permease [Clostridium thermobutyricum]OPX48876.1 putative amino acid permease YhdG [Clostridium thermobutyricum DSM 4928]